MATDKILVERQTDGERCGMKCPWGQFTRCYAFREERTWDLFVHPQIAYRCPACLATPPARELTPEMVEGVNVALEMLTTYDEYGDVFEMLQAATCLRAAFGIEEGTGNSWTCGICGAVRSGVEPVQDAECGDSCPEHYKEEA